MHRQTSNGRRDRKVTQNATQVPVNGGGLAFLSRARRPADRTLLRGQWVCQWAAQWVPLGAISQLSHLRHAAEPQLHGTRFAGSLSAENL